MAWGNIGNLTPEELRLGGQAVAAGGRPTIRGGGIDVSRPSGGGLSIGGQPVGGNGDGYYYDPEMGNLYYMLTSLGFNHAEAQQAIAENARQFDLGLEYDYYNSKQAASTARAVAASSSGATRYASEEATRRAEIQAANALQIAQLDNASRERIATMDMETRLKEMMSRERITAAETWSQPIHYLAYNKWMAGQGAATTESGLPIGAPEFHTGAPAAAYGEGPIVSSDIYGERLMGGGRMSEFGAWGGETGPVDGTPWKPPHQTNLTNFLRMPLQAQEMAYARSRRRGLMPETSQQLMRAAAPIGSAKGVVSYG